MGYASGLYTLQWRQLRQLQRHQQRDQQQRANKQADAIPPAEMPEHPARRAGNARPGVITEQVQRRRLTLGLDRASTDPTARHLMRAEEAKGENQPADNHQQQRQTGISNVHGETVEQAARVL